MSRSQIHIKGHNQSTMTGMAIENDIETQGIDHVSEIVAKLESINSLPDNLISSSPRSKDEHFADAKGTSTEEKYNKSGIEQGYEMDENECDYSATRLDDELTDMDDRVDCTNADNVFNLKSQMSNNFGDRSGEFCEKEVYNLNDDKKNNKGIKHYGCVCCRCKEEQTKKEQQDKHKRIKEITTFYPSLIVLQSDQRLSICQNRLSEVDLGPVPKNLIIKRFNGRHIYERLLFIQKMLSTRCVNFEDWGYYLLCSCDSPVIDIMLDKKSEIKNWTDYVYFLFKYVNFDSLQDELHNEIIFSVPKIGDNIKDYYTKLLSNCLRIEHRYGVEGLISEVKQNLQSILKFQPVFSDITFGVVEIMSSIGTIKCDRVFSEEDVNQIRKLKDTKRDLFR